MTETRKARVGDRIRYWDMANPRREATVIEEGTTCCGGLSFGYMTIEWEDGSTERTGPYITVRTVDDHCAGWALVSEEAS